jgi:hypothetical protein
MGGGEQLRAKIAALAIMLCIALCVVWAIAGIAVAVQRHDWRDWWLIAATGLPPLVAIAMFYWPGRS